MHLPQLSPEQLTERLTNREVVHYASMDDSLWQAIEQHRAAGHLVLCMGAGTIDGWIRDQLARHAAN